MKKQITILIFEYYLSLIAAISIGCGIDLFLGMFLGVLDKAF